MSEFQYIAFHKPYGILSQFTSDNMQETLSIFKLPKNVYPIGRLDKDSEGLLILSDDKELVDRLLNPKSHVKKTYWAQVERVPSEETLNILRQGAIAIEDYKTLPADATLLKNAPNVLERNPPIRQRKTVPTAWIELTISEGKNRQVRKMTAAIGHPTLRLIRVKIGKLELLDLKPGEWKNIKKSDLI